MEVDKFPLNEIVTGVTDMGTGKSNLCGNFLVTDDKILALALTFLIFSISFTK